MGETSTCALRRVAAVNGSSVSHSRERRATPASAPIPPLAYRDGQNPDQWRGHLDQLLPTKTKVRRVVHHAALPYRDIGPFMAELRDDHMARPVRWGS